MTIQATTKEECTVHKTHVPRSHVNHLHHIRPKEYGGINREANRVTVCATGHYNIHELLDALLAYDEHGLGNVPYNIRRFYTDGEQKIAYEGLKRIKEDTHRDPNWKGKGQQEASAGSTQGAEDAEADGSDGQRRLEGEDLQD